MEKGLGRLYIPDERDQAYPMRAVLPREAPERTWRYWFPHGWWGNQGYEPQCVAYAWLHWVEDGPVTHGGRAPIEDPASVYHAAQKIDEWPGENYDGTSVRAGAKILQERGLIETYTWAWNLDDVVRALLTAGPVVVGTTWYAGMSNPTGKFIRPTGEVQGGHAYLLNGVNTEREVLRVKNSWGRGWGDRGYAWITFEDMATLIADHGEACLAVELKRE